jgi:gliding motility-associated-like protein
MDCIWTFNNGSTFNNCGTITNTFTQPGCYNFSLTVSSPNGCTNSLMANSIVCVEDFPTAAFSTSSNVITTLNTEVNFINHSIGANNYIWNFGDTSPISTEENPSHAYAETAGNYFVQLIAQTEFGCSDTTFTEIVIHDELIFYVPNSFTPNFDNYNQTFQPVFTTGFDIFDYTLFIYNRWGEIIFESRDASIGWNGSYGNMGEIEMVQDGVYTWKIVFRVSSNGERKVVTGTVILIR